MDVKISMTLICHVWRSIGLLNPKGSPNKRFPRLSGLGVSLDRKNTIRLDLSERYSREG